MRMSKLFVPTLRDDPSEAEVPNHRLLLRAGFIRQVAAGIYTTLPLALRSMRRIEAIVRDEMDGAGAVELRMPITLPAEPWKATGRWELYGDQLFRLTDRHGREMLLGPTQEEIVTPLVAGDLPSYRDLPINLYQIEWKYRDEFRPRFGLLRGREFLMKDAYSFDRDDEGMRASYETMFAAYGRVLDRCGIDHVVVEAEAGQIGGGINHEFMARAAVGEDLFAGCENGDYQADLRAARPKAPEPVEPGTEVLQELDTPDTPTIEALASLLGVDAAQTLKCVMFDANGRSVAVLVPGDREVNEAKLEQLLFPEPIRRFQEEDFAGRGFVKGYVGPQGFGHDVQVLADHSVRAGRDWVTGSNKADRHVRGVNTPRDFRVDRYEDLIELREGDRCPVDGGALEIERSIVVGHIFQLGTKYSSPLEATFIDEDGTHKPYVMGCYGIGISRILAAAVEQNHDDEGIRWPKALAPFDAVVIMANADDERVSSEAERIYRDLGAAGVDALLDDRSDRAGVKFADADLIGYPVQVTVGRRGIEGGTVDLKLRATGERTTAPLPHAAQAVRDLLQGAP
jgi:prolyl-tRNA synthetase